MQILAIIYNDLLKAQNVYLLILLLAGMGFLFGWVFSKWKSSRVAKEKGNSFYQKALYSRECGLPIRALIFLVNSLDQKESHDACNFIGQIAGELGEWETAARYWGDAKHIALKQAKPSVADWALYYYYREADAYVKDYYREVDAYVKEGLSDISCDRAKETICLSYNRAKEAIFLIETGELPENLEGENYHQKLRAIRMISAFLCFRGNEAWEKMKVDAEWIEENASDEIIINLAKPLLALYENLPRMQEMMEKNDPRNESSIR